MDRYEIVNWSERYENNRSKELKRLDWFPLPNAFDEEEYLVLTDHADGPAHWGAWVAILMAASRQPKARRGQLPTGPQGTSQVVARMSHLPAGLVQAVLDRVLELGLIRLVANTLQEGAEIPQQGAGISQEGAPRARAGALSFGSLPFPSVPVGGRGNAAAFEWPETAAAIRQYFPATDDEMVIRVVHAAMREFVDAMNGDQSVDLTDAMMAEAVFQAHFERQQSPAMFETRVPRCIRTWVEDYQKQPKRLTR